VSPTTRPDRRRADRAAARNTEKRRPAPARQPAQTRKPASRPRRRGAGFLNTLIIALLVVLVVMIVLAFLVLNRYVLRPTRRAAASASLGDGPSGASVHV
jgi:hypothetical protein